MKLTGWSAVPVAVMVGVLGAGQRHVEPPVMARRAITKPATNPAEDWVSLSEGGVPFSVFVPEGFHAPASGEVVLAVHFHGAPWFAVQEHQRRGLAGPLVVFALGEGSSVYQRPFLDRERLARVVKVVEGEFVRRGTPVRVSGLEVSSFSAGYGAVREIVKVPAYVEMIRRIVLCDSMYAGWDPASTRPSADGVLPTSRPMAEQIEPWLEFGRRAMRGEKEFVFTYSQVPTAYANSAACARAVLGALGLKPTAVQAGSSEAARDPEYPLIERCDVGGLHFWGYGGVDAGAHMTHVRHLADVWKALEGK